MSSKVLLISTRKIQKEGIFQPFRRCPQISKSLCDYFLANNKGKLEEYKANYLKELESCQFPDAVDSSTNAVFDVDKLYSEWVEAIQTDPMKCALAKVDKKACKEILRLISENSKAAAVNKFISLYDSIPDASQHEDMVVLRQRSNDLSTALMRVITEERQDNGFTVEDFNTCSDMPWDVNIDATGKTLQERVSLYECAGTNLYHIYTVWPLTTSCNDDSWRDALLQAVLEQNQDCEEIILWLHDNDLEDTSNSTFHVLYYKKDWVINNKNFRISLGVFQHPDPEFNGILFSKVNQADQAKNIFESVDSLFSVIDKMQKCNNGGIIAREYESLTLQMTQKKTS